MNCFAAEHDGVLAADLTHVSAKIVPVYEAMGLFSALYDPRARADNTGLDPSSDFADDVDGELEARSGVT